MGPGIEKIEVTDKEKIEALLELTQHFGDSIIGVFDQMLKGNWKDDHGHEVRTNTAMIGLTKVLEEAMILRAKNHNYPIAEIHK